MDTPERVESPQKTAREGSRMGIGSWTVLVILAGMLLATFVIVYLGWTLTKDAVVPTSAYVAMTFGVITSLAVGFGLMALVFYSSRQGYDEAPVLMEADTLDDDDRASTVSNEKEVNTAIGSTP
jgi:hypothetical protein